MLLKQIPIQPIDLSQLSLSYETGSISPLLISEIFLHCDSFVSIDEDKVITIHDNIEKEPFVQQIISAELREMNENDFKKSSMVMEFLLKMHCWHNTFYNRYEI